MLNRIKHLYLIIVISGFAFGQTIHFSALRMGDDLRASGAFLQKQDYGLHAIELDLAKKDTVFIVVHGYGSRGYEWVYALRQMALTHHQTYYFRNDWEQCPSTITKKLDIAIRQLLKEYTSIEHMIIFGHSYGGMIVSGLADDGFPITMEIHSIAAPLAGTDRVKNACPDYPDFSTINIKHDHTQWRTVHKQDGAFKHMKVDPQVVANRKSRVIQLPPIFKNGRRLGHNWSITYVMDEYLKKEN